MAQVRMVETAKRSTKVLTELRKVAMAQTSTPLIAVGLRSRIGKRRLLPMKRPVRKR